MGNGIIESVIFNNPDDIYSEFDLTGKAITCSSGKKYTNSYSDQYIYPYMEGPDITLGLFLFVNNKLYIYDIKTKKEKIIDNIEDGSLIYYNGYYQISNKTKTKTIIYDTNWNLIKTFNRVFNGNLNIYSDCYIGIDANNITYYIYDKTGKEIYKENSVIKYLEEGRYQVTRGNYIGIIDEKGNWLYKTLIPTLGED